MVRISGKQHGRLHVSSEVAAVLVGQAQWLSYFTLRDLVDHSRNFSWASPCYHITYFSKLLNSR